VNVTIWPLGMTCGVDCSASATCTDGATARSRDASLFAGFGSYWSPVTDAASGISPPPVDGSGSMATVMVADAPAAMAPRSAIRTPSCPIGPAPWLDVAETNCTAGGMGILATTPVAAEGPEFVTRTV